MKNQINIKYIDKKYSIFNIKYSYDELREDTDIKHPISDELSIIKNYIVKLKEILDALYRDLKSISSEL